MAASSYYFITFKALSRALFLLLLVRHIQGSRAIITPIYTGRRQTDTSGSGKPGIWSVQDANHAARSSCCFCEALATPLSPTGTEVVRLWNLLTVPSTQDSHVTTLSKVVFPRGGRDPFSPDGAQSTTFSLFSRQHQH